MKADSKQLKIFGQLNFASSKLDELRRTRRLVCAAYHIARYPGGSLPDNFQSSMEIKALHRLCDCDEVTHEAVFQSPCQRVHDEMNQRDETIFVIHDTTELDYTNNASLEDDLGQTGDTRRRG